MQAWNLYHAVLLAHNPTRALELFGYQWLICSPNTLLPEVQYNSEFHTLTTAELPLHWDQRHPDLWLECLASGQQKVKRWPCPYYGSTNHFPRNCLDAPFRHKQHSSDYRPTQKIFPPNLWNVYIKDTVPIKAALINTSAFPVEVNTPRPFAQEEELPPISAYSKAPYIHHT